MLSQNIAVFQRRRIFIAPVSRNNENQCPEDKRQFFLSRILFYAMIVETQCRMLGG